LTDLSRIELARGDITLEQVDAIVNAANTTLRGGGGVDGAIHRAGGPAILAECVELGGCETGEAKATGAGWLAAHHVIHTVGPIWQDGDRGEVSLLGACYRNSLELAAKLGCRSVAFPSISTGVYRFPLDRAAPIAISAVVDALAELPQIERVRFVLFDQDTFSAFRQALLIQDDRIPPV
jgi:O-acetyl-ADP-ribose deacetylase (regulator of RNase III)